jgi:ribonuclease VapC
MVVDASAILAVLKEEPDRLAYAEALSRRVEKRISPVNWYEGAVKLEDTGDFALYERFVREAEIEIAPIDETIMRLAHRAWLRYGKGRSPAKLNLGDCFAYATAKALGEPLLFKGTDFPKTDIQSAL